MEDYEFGFAQLENDVYMIYWNGEAKLAIGYRNIFLSNPNVNLQLLCMYLIKEVIGINEIP
jgi:hypothetical protein